MATLITNELRKLRSIRTWWVLLLVQLVLIVVGVSGAAISLGITASDPTLVTKLISHAGILSLFALVLGVNAVAAEYRHRTITDTYLATPRRERVIVAKLVTYTGVGLVFGIASAAVAVATTAAWFAAKDVPLTLGTDEVMRTVAGAIAWNALYAALGVSLGALVPNLGGAIGAALAWIAIVEGLVGQLLGDSARWLPMAAGRALGNMPGDVLPQLSGGLVLGAYAIALAVLAAVTSMRRDVT
jgi:ABC-2 type transport system permease protein